MKFESKNVKTIALLTLISFLGTLLSVFLQKSGLSTYYAYDQSPPNPYLMPIEPLLYIGVPLMLVISFVLGIFSIAREDSPSARNQAIILTLIVLVLAYTFTFSTFNRMGGY